MSNFPPSPYGSLSLHFLTPGFLVRSGNILPNPTNNISGLNTGPQFSNADPTNNTGRHFNIAGPTNHTDPQFDNGGATNNTSPSFIITGPTNNTGPQITFTGPTNHTFLHFNFTGPTNTASPHFDFADPTNNVGPHFDIAGPTNITGPRFNNVGPTYNLDPHFDIAGRTNNTGPHFDIAGPTNMVPRFNNAGPTNNTDPQYNITVPTNNMGPESNIAGPSPQTMPYNEFVAVFVGDLSTVVGEESLFKFFHEKGINVATAKVCRDETGNSRGYGYVNFFCKDDAAFAIRMLNNNSLYGRQIRLMWSTRNSEAVKNNVGIIHVKNLSLVIGDEKLYEIFARVVPVLSVNVMRNEDKSSQRHGFVQFTTKELADIAIQALDGTFACGNKMIVEHYVRKSEQKGNNGPDSFTNVFVKNIGEEIDENLILHKFSKFGRVTSVKIEKDQKGNSKGFCFICFENPENAKIAVQDMNGSQLGKNIIYVARVMKKDERAQFLQSQNKKKLMEIQMGSNVYVRNLSENVDENILKEYFSKCGQITSAKVMRDNNGFSKCFGFVCFSKPQEAQKAIATLNDKFLFGKPLYLAPHEPKEDHKAKLKNAHALNGPLNALNGPLNAFNATTSSALNARRLNGYNVPPSNAFVPGMYQPRIYYSPYVVPQAQYNRPLMTQTYIARDILPASNSSLVPQQAPNNQRKKFNKNKRKNKKKNRNGANKPKLENTVQEIDDNMPSLSCADVASSE